MWQIRKFISKEKEKDNSESLELSFSSPKSRGIANHANVYGLRPRVEQNFQTLS